MSVPAATTASTPAVLLAEIPATLGFYPENSVVFCTLSHAESGALRLGVVMRMDCGDTKSLAEIAAHTAQTSPDVVFAIIVADSLDHAFMQAVADAGIQNLEVIWHLTCIAEDEPYKAVWTAERRHAYTSEFLEGTVAPIHQAASTQATLTNGGVIAVSRDELLRALTFDEDRREDGAGTYVLAEDLLAAAPSQQHLVLALREALRLGRNADPQGLVVAALLDGVGTRDLVLGELIDQPEQAVTVLEDLVPQLEDNQLRAGVLSLLACVLLVLGRRSHASLVIQAAEQACPEYSLVQLLMRARLDGLFDMVIRSLHEGVKITRDRAGLEAAA
ncbi:DUF4192 domain-containing protein [Corynebacterium sp. 153RC1]|uniref:DUF4192 domain-containing protein n=1 Tax=unclassified Corynebacterium TaxID=2624378 RepID=UPI00211BD39A|nr:MULTISPECIES: DUF4192 domain-containing protein [unclassified Corynebacterium]MCQ9351901.1 DUF4192 domain-containing protein [Corynebacterium sp. 209RC1]MCQ9355058.1 DUF4192 domain-containing protein [Corynebacterium sp. 1222RC1]MCQ9356183.1 DUF4192 domain-containing protein [Corynebacterium sp. 122RC1]MCQ9359578.1 DUF4192 domain-containing protein [Corynebacterium sp. 142RC1]MCQ9360797.1 DUF4192 domain-containing protein [Corynebacterium sp. 153RC1]